MIAHSVFAVLALAGVIATIRTMVRDGYGRRATCEEEALRQS
jgi:hypothetical protein